MVDRKKADTMAFSSRGSGNILDYFIFKELGERKHSRFLSSISNVRGLVEKAAAEPSQNVPCEFSGEPRATFLMDFSPNKKLVASTHGDHTVRVTNVSTGVCTHVLTGHPRTPWCLAFHPASNDILASGCLGGEIRIWDLLGGGQEVLQNPKINNVITSLAFHPTGRVLVFATCNYIYFWDWSKSTPFACSSTAHEYERVRWLKFDPFGKYLYTGIANNTTVRDFRISGGNQQQNESTNSESRDRNTDDYPRPLPIYIPQLPPRSPRRYDAREDRVRSPVVEERLSIARDFASHITDMANNPRPPSHGNYRSMGASDRSERPDPDGDDASDNEPYDPFNILPRRAQSRRRIRNRRLLNLTQQNPDQPQQPGSYGPLFGVGRSMLPRMSNTNDTPDEPTLGAGRFQGTQPNFMNNIGSRARNGSPPLERRWGRFEPSFFSDTNRSSTQNNGSSRRRSSSVTRRNVSETTTRSSFMQALPRYQNSNQSDLHFPFQEASGAASPLIPFHVQGPSGASNADPASSSQSFSSFGGASRVEQDSDSMNNNNLFSFRRIRRLAPVLHSHTREYSRLRNTSFDISNGASAIDAQNSSTSRGSQNTSRASSNTNNNNNDHHEVHIRTNFSSPTEVSDYNQYVNPPQWAITRSFPVDISYNATSQIQPTEPVYLYRRTRARGQALLNMISRERVTLNDQASQTLGLMSLPEMQDQGTDVGGLYESQDSFSTNFSNLGHSGISEGNESLTRDLSTSNSQSSLLSPLQITVPEHSLSEQLHSSPSEQFNSLCLSNNQSEQKDFPEYSSLDVILSPKSPPQTIVNDLPEQQNSVLECLSPIVSHTVTVPYTTNDSPSAVNVDEDSSENTADIQIPEFDRLFQNKSTHRNSSSESTRSTNHSSLSLCDHFLQSSSRGRSNYWLERSNSSESSLRNSRSNCLDLFLDSSSRPDMSETVGSGATDFQTNASDNEEASRSTEGQHENVSWEEEVNAARILASLGCSLGGRSSSHSSDRSSAVDASTETDMAATADPRETASISSSMAVSVGSASSDTTRTGESPTVSNTETSAISSLPVSSSTDRITEYLVRRVCQLDRRISDLEERCSSSMRRIREIHRDFMRPPRSRNRSNVSFLMRNLSVPNVSEGASARTTQRTPTRSRLRFSRQLRSRMSTADLATSESQRNSSRSLFLANANGSTPMQRIMSEYQRSERTRRINARRRNFQMDDTDPLPDRPDYSAAGPDDDIPNSSMEAARLQRVSVLQPQPTISSGGVSIGVSQPNSFRRYVALPSAGDSAFRTLMDQPGSGEFQRIEQEDLDEELDLTYISGAQLLNNTHRIQQWDISEIVVPDISDPKGNIVVEHCKLHNDASCEISSDGTTLATFIPYEYGYRTSNLAVFSLQPNSFGQILFKKRFGSNAISVSISPDKNYLMVGLASQRLFFLNTGNHIAAHVYQLTQDKSGNKTMEKVNDIYHPPSNENRQHVSVNSAKWLPNLGEGLVYGTNKGDLNFCRAWARKIEWPYMYTRGHSGTSEMNSVSTQTMTVSIRHTASTQTTGTTHSFH